MHTLGQSMQLIAGFAARARALATRTTAAKPPVLACLGRISLGGTKSVVVIEFETKRFLIATSADSIACVHAIAGPGSWPDEPAQSDRDDV